MIKSLTNMSTLQTLDWVYKVIDWVDHFLPKGASRALSPNQLFQSQASALLWLSSASAGRFYTMLEQIKNGPIECVFGNENNRKWKVNLFLLDLAFCKKYFRWTQEDEQALLFGMYAYTIVDQTDAYEAFQKILDGTEQLVDWVISDLKNTEVARRAQIELKWRRRWEGVRQKIVKIRSLFSAL